MRICNKADKECKNCGHDIPHKYCSESNTKLEPAIGFCSHKFCELKNIKVRCVKK